MQITFHSSKLLFNIRLASIKDKMTILNLFRLFAIGRFNKNLFAFEKWLTPGTKKGGLPVCFKNKF